MRNFIFYLILVMFGILLVLVLFSIGNSQPYVRNRNYDASGANIIGYKVCVSADPNTYDPNSVLALNMDPNGFIFPAESNGDLNLDLVNSEVGISYVLKVQAISEKGVFSCISILTFIRNVTPSTPELYITKEDCSSDRWLYVTGSP